MAQQPGILGSRGRSDPDLVASTARSLALQAQAEDDKDGSDDDLVEADSGMCTAITTVRASVISNTTPPAPPPPAARISLTALTPRSQPILAGQAAGGRKALNGDADWTQIGVVSYYGDMPGIDDILEMPEIVAIVKAHDGGGGGFTNAGMPPRQNIAHHAQHTFHRRLGTR